MSGETKLPIVDIVNKLKDPLNSLTEEEKNQIKMITGDVGSAVKASLIQLLMGQFSKVDTYNAAIDQVMKSLLAKIPLMETDELIASLSVLTKTSTTAAKGVMDVFQKQGNNMKELVEDLQKLAKKGRIVDAEDLEDEPKKPKSIINLPPEKKDKLIRLMHKLSDKRKEEEDNAEEDITATE